MDLIKIGKYIAGKRKELALTQKQLAEKLGMSDKSVSKWERGVCLPDVSVYAELCDILGISINEFLAGEDIPKENMIRKSEENIIGVTKDSKKKQKDIVKKEMLAIKKKYKDDRRSIIVSSIDDISIGSNVTEKYVENYVVGVNGNDLIRKVKVQVYKKYAGNQTPSTEHLLTWVLYHTINCTKSKNTPPMGNLPPHWGLYK